MKCLWFQRSLGSLPLLLLPSPSSLSSSIKSFAGDSTKLSLLSCFIFFPDSARPSHREEDGRTRAPTANQKMAQNPMLRQQVYPSPHILRVTQSEPTTLSRPSSHLLFCDVWIHSG
ncbi:hypothetical protein BHM03_00006084 [Ensete ventricosum]|nr:hypothetical protein BHM03_00006084 [Ensete ventricosum]